MKRLSRILSVVLCLSILLSCSFVYAASIGSSVEDKFVGADTVQGATTKYTEMGEGNTDTEVYLTVDDSNVVVGVPTEIIVSGTPTETGEYIGEYSVIAKGDLAGNKTIRIEPEDNVVLKQVGKSDVTATISQEKTSFTYNDIITNANTSTGEVVAEGLTAGSWSGEFVFNIAVVQPNAYYSTLALAVEDINNGTINTSSTTADMLTSQGASCGVFDANSTGTYRIEIFNDLNDVQSITLERDAEIDLNSHTINFTDGQYLTYNKNLTIYDGTINAVDSSYIISGRDTNTTSVLSLKNLELNEIVTENINTTNITQIESYSLYNNFKNVAIGITGVGNVSYNIRGASLINSNSTNKIDEISFISDIDNSKSIRGIQFFGYSVVKNPVVNIVGLTGNYIGIMALVNSIETVIDNANIRASVQSADGRAYGLQIGSQKVEINGCDIYAEALNNINGGMGILFSTTESTIINSTKQNPVTVYGKQWGIQTSRYGTTTINGGAYTSTDHTGYILGNADIYNADFYIANREKYSLSTIDDSFGLYCGSDNEITKDCVVNLYDCRIGNKYKLNNNFPRFSITAKTNGYFSQKEINLTDCELYQGYDALFDYNYVSKSNKGFTKFNLYGDTKLYRENGGIEFTKDELVNAINTWKNSNPYWWNEGVCRVKDDNKIIGGYYYTTNYTELSPEDIYEEYANVYDYRP